MMGNFSLNIYSVALLAVRKNLLLEEKAFLSGVFSCQIFILSIRCLILIQFSEKFYSCQQSIFRLASFPTIPFHGYLLKTKPHVKDNISLALFYEVVHSNKPFRFNAAWFGIISKQSMLHFFEFYMIHLLLSFKFANK